MSMVASSETSLASATGGISRPMSGPLLPAWEVEKNNGSKSLKSSSASIRSTRTDPTIPRHPTNATFNMIPLFRFILS